MSFHPFETVLLHAYELASLTVPATNVGFPACFVFDLCHVMLPIRPIARCNAMAIHCDCSFVAFVCLFVTLIMWSRNRPAASMNNDPKSSKEQPEMWLVLTSMEASRLQKLYLSIVLSCLGSSPP